MNFNLLNIGFGNMVMGDKVIAIISPESAPIKRMIQEARERIFSLMLRSAVKPDPY